MFCCGSRTWSKSCAIDGASDEGPAHVEVQFIWTIHCVDWVEDTGDIGIRDINRLDMVNPQEDIFLDHPIFIGGPGTVVEIKASSGSGSTCIQQREVGGWPLGVWRNQAWHD